MFSCKFCEVFNNAFLTKHLRPTPLTPKSRPMSFVFFDPHPNFMDQRHPHQNCDPRHPRQNFINSLHPRHPRFHVRMLPMPPTLFSTLFKEGLMACSLITFYDKKTEHRGLKRKHKEIYQKTLLGQVIFEQGTAWKQITNHIIFAKYTSMGSEKIDVIWLIAVWGSESPKCSP